MNMNRRTFVSAFLAVPIVGALAACGDPDQPAAADPTTPDATDGPTPTSPSTTAAPVDITHPTGADDVVLKLSNEGGFVPVGYAFVNTPTLLVSGDGRAFTPAPVPMIYPGQLLPAVSVRQLTEAEVQSMLAVVNDAGLLATPPDYTGGDNVADATTTVLTVNADGGTFTHSAYALGIAGEETGARKNLLDATNRLSEMLGAPGAPDSPFVPTTYRFQARVVDSSELTGQEPAPSIVDWPASTGVALASAAQCARVDASAVGSLFADAKQNTYFKEGDVVYQLAVAGVLPGDPPC